MTRVRAELRRRLAALASLKLTVVCLTLLMALVVACTLAQVRLGIYGAVQVYIRGLFVWWGPPGASWRVPVAPGGALVGLVLLANLAAAQILRLEPSRRKAGIWIAHLGLVVLFAGEFATALFSVETQLPVEIGETRNYTESAREAELAVVDATDPRYDEVVSIPESLLSRRMSLSHPKLPFTLLVKRYYANAELAPQPEGGSVPASMANAGPGAGLTVFELPPSTTDDRRDQPAAFVELVSGSRSLGAWLLSTAIGGEQPLEYMGRSYRLSLRARRRYLPFSLTLKEFKHEVYPGTDIPKNFASLVRLEDPARAESRDVLIYMNHPLRHGGKAFYQASFGKNDTLSILQVVDNRGWLLPYVACALAGLGLLLHFLSRFDLKPLTAGGKGA